MHLVRHRWKLQIDLLVFVGCNQACSGMPKILRNNKYPLSPFFYIGFCFKYSESTWSSQLPFSKRFLDFLVYKLISWRVIKRLTCFLCFAGTKIFFSFCKIMTSYCGLLYFKLCILSIWLPPRHTSDHYRGGSLTHTMLIFAYISTSHERFVVRHLNFGQTKVLQLGTFW